MLGPPPTSGTRDAFLELVMDQGAAKIKSLAALKKSDAKAFENVWKSIREDGAYIDAGENDNLIVQKLEANPQAVGIFGYSFLEENASKIKGAEIDGVVPTFETIADGTYDGRPSALRLLQEAACRRRSRPRRNSSPSTPPTRRWARTAISPPRAWFRFRPTSWPSSEEAAKALETIAAPTS